MCMSSKIVRRIILSHLIFLWFDFFVSLEDPCWKSIGKQNIMKRTMCFFATSIFFFVGTVELFFLFDPKIFFNEPNNDIGFKVSFYYTNEVEFDLRCRLSYLLDNFHSKFDVFYALLVLCMRGSVRNWLFLCSVCNYLLWNFFLLSVFVTYSYTKSVMVQVILASLTG